jgi:hypothetical protein
MEEKTVWEVVRVTKTERLGEAERVTMEVADVEGVHWVEGVEVVVRKQEPDAIEGDVMEVKLGLKIEGVIVGESVFEVGEEGDEEKELMKDEVNMRESETVGEKLASKGV